MQESTTVLGLAAAAFTSLAYIPQVRKALPPGATGDLSLSTLSVLITGLGLWVIYGIATADPIIWFANSLGVGLVGTVLACKLRDISQNGN